MSPPVPSQQVPSGDATSRPLTAVISPDRPRRPVPGPFAGEPSWADLIRHARCADAGLDPDQWFPVSAEAGKARREAAAAIAVCSSCLVRAGCLALSLRHWDVGQHGVWGGMVPAERVQLRRRVLADHDGDGRALGHIMTAASGA